MRPKTRDTGALTGMSTRRAECEPESARQACSVSSLTIPRPQTNRCDKGRTTRPPDIWLACHLVSPTRRH